MSEFKVFYSWQSDLPNNTNWTFIEKVLDKSARSIKDSPWQLRVDRDTKGIPGSPDIEATILEKIRSCDLFVADISFVAKGFDHLGKAEQRLCPNPNVMFELGIAAQYLGWNRIILFFNKCFGSEKDLPFDIRQHVSQIYDLSPAVDDKASVRQAVTAAYTKEFQVVLDSFGKHVDTTKPILRVKWSKNFALMEFDKLHLSIDKKIEEVLKYVEEGFNGVDLEGTSIYSDSPAFERRYISDVLQYAESLKNMKREIHSFFNCSSGYAQLTGLIIENSGGATGQRCST